MTIEYTCSEGKRIERYFHNTMNGGLCATKKKGFALGFKLALDLCGVKFIMTEMKKGGYAFRTYASNGGEYPEKEWEEYRKEREELKKFIENNKEAE